MAVGAGVRKLTSRSHLEAESIGGTCTSQEGDEGGRRRERERVDGPFPSLDTTRTHNTLLHDVRLRLRPVLRAAPSTRKAELSHSTARPITVD